MFSSGISNIFSAESLGIRIVFWEPPWPRWEDMKATGYISPVAVLLCSRSCEAHVDFFFLLTLEAEALLFINRRSFGTVIMPGKIQILIGQTAKRMKNARKVSTSLCMVQTASWFQQSFAKLLYSTYCSIVWYARKSFWLQDLLRPFSPPLAS